MAEKRNSFEGLRNLIVSLIVGLLHVIMLGLLLLVGIFIYQWFNNQEEALRTQVPLHGVITFSLLIATFILKQNFKRQIK